MFIFSFFIFSKSDDNSTGKYCLSPVESNTKCASFSDNIVQFSQIESYTFSPNSNMELQFLIVDSSQTSFPLIDLQKFQNIKVSFEGNSENEYLNFSEGFSSIQELHLKNIHVDVASQNIHITTSLMSATNVQIPVTNSHLYFTFTSLETDDSSLASVSARVSLNDPASFVLKDSHFNNFVIQQHGFLINNQTTLSNAQWSNYTVYSTVNFTIDYSGEEEATLEKIPNFILQNDYHNLTFNTGWRKTPMAARSSLKGNITLARSGLLNPIAYSNAGLYPQDSFNIDEAIYFRINPSGTQHGSHIKLIIGLSILGVAVVTSAILIFFYCNLKRPVHVKKAERRESEFGQYIHTD